MLKVAGFSSLFGWMFLLYLTALAERSLSLWFSDWIYLFLGSLHLFSLLLGLPFDLSSSFLLPDVYPQGQLCNFIPFRLHFSRINRSSGHLFYFNAFFSWINKNILSIPGINFLHLWLLDFLLLQHTWPGLSQEHQVSAQRSLMVM